MLIKSEFKAAVRKARQVFVYVRITPNDGMNVKISKATALTLVREFGRNDKISAIQSADETTVWIG